VAFLVTSQLHSELRFDEFRQAVEISVNKALVKGGAILLNAILDRETRIGDASPKRRVSPGVHLHDSFHIAIQKTLGLGQGRAAIVVWTPNANAIWQELGTRGSRRKKLKRGGGGDTEGNRGVKPLYFMRRGFTAAYPEVEELIATAVASVGEFGGGAVVHDTTSTNFLSR
jgi:hypothetical protein